MATIRCPHCGRRISDGKTVRAPRARLRHQRLPASLCKPSLEPHFHWDASSNSDYDARPVVLDAFCGAGGAGFGYFLAGFRVVGVDHVPQPCYPFEFHLADALEFCAERGREFDVIHSSPPCQFRARVTAWTGDRPGHPDLITPLRPILDAVGRPFIIENVEDARWMLRDPILLCGSMFGLRVRRHRYFEISLPMTVPTSPCYHVGLRSFVHKNERAYTDAMGCHWMTNIAGRQAIPPAFTEFIGCQLKAVL